MLEKDCNGNPISTFPPCYAFQMIFTALAPGLIQSISHNVHNKNRSLKHFLMTVSFLETLKRLDTSYNALTTFDQQLMLYGQRQSHYVVYILTRRGRPR